MKTKSKPKSKFVKILVICVIILICVFAVALLIRNSKKTENQDNQTFTVRKEIFENVIEISGNISAAESQSLQAAGEGTVQKVFVKEGEKVKKGDVLCTLHAMKMDNRLCAPIDGEVKAVNIEAGQNVSKNDVLIEIV